MVAQHISITKINATNSLKRRIKKLILQKNPAKILYLEINIYKIALILLKCDRKTKFLNIFVVFGFSNQTYSGKLGRLLMFCGFVIHFP